MLVIVLVVGGTWLFYEKELVATPVGNSIKLGGVVSLTGIAAGYGEPARNAMQLAVEEINESGGIESRPVTLVVEDDQTKPVSAISAFRKLTQIDGVDGVVGGIFDFATIPLFPVADAEKVAFISPTNLRISGGLEPTGNSFVLMPDFSKVIRELKTYLFKSQTKKLGVVHFKSVFGQQIATTLSEIMAELNREPIVDEAYTTIGNNDFRTTILKLKQQKVDVVFLDMVDIDPVNFLARSRDLDYHPQVISYYGIVDSFSAPDKDKSLLEGVVILNWESSSARFSALYQKRYGVLPTHSAEKSYVAVYVMAQAIAATKNREEVPAYLASHSFETPSGTIAFNADHAVNTTAVKIEMVKDGKLVPFQ